MLRKIVLLSLTLLLTSCVTPFALDKPQVELLSIQGLPAASQGPRFLMTLKVTNPNRESLTLDGVYYELSVQGKALLSGTSNKSVTIAGYDASQVALTADVSMFNVIRLLGGLMQSPQPDDLPYKFYSKISVREFKIPVYYTTEGSVGQELFGTSR